MTDESDRSRGGAGRADGGRAGRADGGRAGRTEGGRGGAGRTDGGRGGAGSADGGRARRPEGGRGGTGRGRGAGDADRGRGLGGAKGRTSAGGRGHGRQEEARSARRPRARQDESQPTRGRSQAQPEIPTGVTADQLDPQVRAELRTLPRDLADYVGRHLAAADRATEPEVALAHATAARAVAARVGVVREACGVAAYLAGHWAEALAELRAARRLTGRPGYLAMMADSERALGRYDRALALVTGPDAAAADPAERIELRIVESGIRRDMGTPDAAVVVLQVPELTQKRLRPWSARLYYAYADALLDAGRADEARDWFGRAAAADTEGETDAAERFDELDDVLIEDLEDAGPQSNEEAQAL